MPTSTRDSSTEVHRFQAECQRPTRDSLFDSMKLHKYRSFFPGTPGRDGMRRRRIHWQNARWPVRIPVSYQYVPAQPRVAGAFASRLQLVMVVVYLWIDLSLVASP